MGPAHNGIWTRVVQRSECMGNGTQNKESIKASAAAWQNCTTSVMCGWSRFRLMKVFPCVPRLILAVVLQVVRQRREAIMTDTRVGK